MKEMKLDQLESYQQVDKNNMLNIILRLPEDIKKAYISSKDIEIPSEIRRRNLHLVYKRPRNIIVCGMGGSAIGGLILKCWLSEKLPVPIDVIRDYRIPAYANKETLALIVSYSGNTEEALSCFIEALKKGCMTIALTSNGLLQRYAKKLKIPFYSPPKGMPPRTAIAYLSIPLAVILEKLGFNLNLKLELEETFNTLRLEREEIRPEVPYDKNIAKQLAKEIKGMLPVVYAYTSYYAAAFRFKTQLNENSKYPAKCEEMPELNHNEIVGWTLSEDVGKHSLIIYMIGGDEPPEIIARFNITEEIIKDKVGGIIRIHGRGISRLSRLFSLIYLGDFASYYLAILNNVDPTPVLPIERLKRELSKRRIAMERIEKECKALIEN